MLLRLWLAGALAAGLACAQRGGSSPESRAADDQAVMRSDPTRLEILTANLKLKSAQEKQIRSALDDIQKDAAPVRDEMAAKRARIAAAVQAGQAQSEIDSAVTAYAATAARMAALEMKAFAGIYQALDPDQRKAAAPAFNMMNGIFQGKNWNISPSSPRR